MMEASARAVGDVVLFVEEVDDEVRPFSIENRGLVAVCHSK